MLEIIGEVDARHSAAPNLTLDVIEASERSGQRNIRVVVEQRRETLSRGARQKRGLALTIGDHARQFSVPALIAGAQLHEKRSTLVWRRVEYRIDEWTELAPIIGQQWDSGAVAMLTPITSHHPAKQHLRFRPVTLNRPSGNAQGFRCLNFTQAAKEAALYDLA